MYRQNLTASECINTTSSVQSYSFWNKFIKYIIITAPSGEIKAIGAGSYGNTVNLAQLWQVNDTTINVRFIPTVVGNTALTNTSTLQQQKNSVRVME
ncbi:MAG: hypothetical protein R2753_11690 [Chitinophagales bacterium]